MGQGGKRMPGKGPSGRFIEEEATIAAPRERVFNALTDTAELGEWMALSAESDARAGGRFRLNWTSQHMTGTYAAVDPPGAAHRHWGWL